MRVYCLPYKPMAYKRINLTLTEELHKIATAHALNAHATDFSGLVAKLILQDLRSTTAISSMSEPAPKQVSEPVKAKS
jgi:hypothetical protein